MSSDSHKGMVEIISEMDGEQAQSLGGFRFVRIDNQDNPNVHWLRVPILGGQLLAFLQVQWLFGFKMRLDHIWWRPSVEEQEEQAVQEDSAEQMQKKNLIDRYSHTKQLGGTLHVHHSGQSFFFRVRTSIQKCVPETYHCRYGEMRLEGIEDSGTEPHSWTGQSHKIVFPEEKSGCPWKLPTKKERIPSISEAFSSAVISLRPNPEETDKWQVSFDLFEPNEEAIHPPDSVQNW